ncbi:MULTISPECIES: DUF6745 domain-containing protein [Calothrix]|uniref:DUF6745 domain-containing protein n=2 Tax=Calothrix TaxID=1186 RepID=A0ABR8A2T2_9CYAN|nr:MULTISPECIES: hypothetical protein [Calothrix]MBD2194237.1 hypothetical protein [Calothrix parietina FACHB-288]MBD2225033.1 hypothetical protein [Calothrix anomala FACHB-343]
MSLIEKLTPQHEALIPVYREKWRKIALSTERINRDKAAEVVETVYLFAGKKLPQIIFCNSPYQAITEMLLLNSSQNKLENNLVDSVEDLIEHQLQDFWKQLSFNPISLVFRENNLDNLESAFRQENTLNLLGRVLSINQSELVWQLWSNNVTAQAIYSFDWIDIAATFDFFISEIDCYYDHKVYQVVEQVLVAGMMIFPFEGFCFICDRPLHLRFDNQNRLHAEGEPAIEYADGFSLYSYHGVTLPEKYGKLHPQQWQAQWLLTEDNAELRRVLIQGIGYARICQELQAIELDTWREYTLLKIAADVDAEPIYLLKMTCPSTGFIHALRVPPDMTSAHQAICWVNWGIAPEEFAIQT